MRKQVLRRDETLRLKRKAAKRAKKEIRSIVPFSPLGRKTKAANKDPAPAPIRSKK